jgi:hypothetical protein
MVAAAAEVAAVLLTGIVGTEVGTGGGMGRTETEGVSGAADGVTAAVSWDDGRLAGFGRRRDSVEMRIAANFPTFDDPDRGAAGTHLLHTVEETILRHNISMKC